MKRILSLALIMLFVFSFAVLPVGAAKEYSTDGLTFSVPSILENDEKWAEDSGYAYAFCDTDINMEFNVSVYENSGYSYVGFTESELQAYGEEFASYYEDEEYTVEDVVTDSYTLKNGFKGAKFHFSFTNGEQYLFYWFATDELCYDLDFYVYDASFVKYVYEVMETATIEGTPCEDGSLEPSGDSSGDYGEITEEEVPDVLGEYGINFEIPEEYELEFSGMYYDYPLLLWNSKDYNFEFDAIIMDNDDGNDYSGYSEEELDEFLAIESEYYDDELITLLDSSVESVEINGMEGVKLTFEYEENDQVCKEADYYFSTDSYEYIFYIYVYDDSYIGYEDEIMSTVKINTESGNGGSSDNNFSSSGFSFTVPSILHKDSEEIDGSTEVYEWSSKNGEFFMDLIIEANGTDANYVYVDYEYSDYQNIYNDLKDSISYITDDGFEGSEIKVNGFEGIKLVCGLDYGEGYEEYKLTACFFSTKDTIYTVIFYSEGDKYDEDIEEIINSFNIQGRPFTGNEQTVIYIIVAVVLAVIGAISKAIKRKKAKNQPLPEGYAPVNADGSRVFFDPNNQQYGQPQYQGNGGYQDGYNGDYDQGGYQNGADDGYTPYNGYVNNDGYAPDYDYSNRTFSDSETSGYTPNNYNGGQDSGYNNNNF